MSKSIAKLAYTQALQEISALYNAANKTFAQTYWEIGKRIVVVEQNGNVRARYGIGLLEKFSKDLSAKHGKGFSYANVKRMRQFYLAHPKGSTLSLLSWSKSINLLSVDDKRKREDLERKSVKNNLSSRAIRKEVKESNSTPNLTIPSTFACACVGSILRDSGPLRD